MKWKKATAVTTAAAMFLSLFTGVCTGIGTKTETAMAAVTTTLPSVSGLYVAEYYEWEDDSDRILTDTDAAGNTVLVNRDGEQIRWQDQDNPDYLTDGVKDGWGMGFDNMDEKWFDYIADGKVTHVNASDLVITHLDGTPCNDITVTADFRDSRLVVFHVNKVENVRISYKGAETNNTLVGEFGLRSGFYSSETMSLDADLHSDISVANGKSKDIYFHMTDTWEEAGFRFDPEKEVKIAYWDREKEQEIELTGSEVADYVTVTPVSVTDVHHLVYKVTVQGKANSDNGFEIRMNFTKYNVNNESDANEEDRRIFVNIVEANTLYAVNPDRMTVKGDRYVYLDENDLTKDYYYSAGSLTAPVYLQFKASDENGNMTTVTDLSKLSFYRIDWNDEEQKDVFTKVDSSVIKAEKAYSDSDLVKITFVGNAEEDFGNEFVVTYDGTEPKQFEEHKNISIAFGSPIYNEISTYSGKKVGDSSFTSEIKTDGTKNETIYAASVDVSDKIFWNIVNSAELKNVSLVDENGNDLSSKVKTGTATLTEETGRKIIYGEEITIPKGTLSASAQLDLEFTIHATGGDGQNNDYQQTQTVYIFYSAPADTTPKKGTKATVSGLTYKVTAVGKTNTVTLTAGKKNAKSATIPATVKISGTTFKVTQIGANAFKGNTKLAKATIGNNVMTIGKQAFNGCKALKTITIKGTALKKVASKAFTNVPKTATAKVPAAKKTAYQKLLKAGGYTGKVK